MMAATPPPTLSETESLAKARCFNHPIREAAVRCPECTRFFCRECVSEHGERFLCAACIAAITGDSERRRNPLAIFTLLFRTALGFLLLWVLFHAMGSALIAVPDTFHDSQDQAAWFEDGFDEE